jgi:hypothetical protein
MSTMGPLNLQDADLKGFEAVEAGRYNAEIFSITMDAVKNLSGTGKMPAGTPMVKVQFRLTDEGVENRRVFSTYVIPPNDYDATKASKLKGMLARFFIALGDPEEKVMSSSFAPDFEDYIGRPCVVIVGKEAKKDQSGSVIPDEFNNPVKGVKPAGTIAGSEAVSGGLL